jgi:hypothetical protein
MQVQVGDIKNPMNQQYLYIYRDYSKIHDNILTVCNIIHVTACIR